jgi:hypothetical protein
LRTFLKGHKMNTEEQSVQICNGLLFPKIFRTFRIAMYYKNLITALLALVVICLAGLIMDFSRTVVTTKDAKDSTTELQIYLTNPDRVQLHIETYEAGGGRTGVFRTLLHFAAARFKGAVDALFAFDIPGVVANVADCFKAVWWALTYHPYYCLIFGVLKLMVISVAGGAICRSAALQFARDEKPGLAEALCFSAKRLLSLCTAPLLPVLTIVVSSLCVVVLGLLGNIPWVGELMVGIFMILALLAGALIASALIFTVAGFGLMFPAVAFDGSDCLGAFGRAFHYVFSRPWRMGFYTVVAAVYGALCYVFVRFFAFLMLAVTRWSLRVGIWVENSEGTNKLDAIWPEPSFTVLLGSAGAAPASWSESVAAFVVYLLVLLVIGLVVSFIMSFYFSANTIIYSLMRNKVDSTPLEDIYTYSEEPRTGSTEADSEPEESKSEPPLAE